MTASLVIPAFNERSRIEACVRGIAGWLASQPGGWTWEVLIVDDGSTDGTKTAAERAAQAERLPVKVLRNEVNRGKGRAVRTGVLASTGDPVLVSDVDLSTPLTEWTKLADHPVAQRHELDTDGAIGGGIALRQARRDRI